MAPPPPVDQYQRHVAALAFPFSSHASSLLATIHRLATALPNTVFSFISTSQSNNSLFSNTNVSLPRNIKVYDVADGVPEGYVFAGKPQEAIELFMHAAPVNLKRTLEASVANMGKPVCCLITDAFLWFGAHLADDMGATWVSFWIAGLNSLSVHVHTDLIRQTVGTHSTAERENELIAKYVNIPGLSTIRIKDLQEGVVFGNLDSVFSRMLLQMGRMLPRATAVFLDCFEELDIETANDLKSKLNKLLNVGPSIVASPPSPKSVDATAGCLAWLGKQDAASVVYIGFGTVAKPSDVELMEIAEALETTETPFLWSIKESFKTPLLNEFLKTRLSKLNGMVVPWAPQPHVLAHAAVGAFVTHAGWQSMLEAIAGGVPLICRPFFGDQRLNARMAEAQLEIGVIVEGGVFTKTGLVKALELVLSTERGTKMRDNTKPIKQLAQQAVGPDGSSTRNFKSLLDVISGTNSV